ncbi:G-type lectin S-receptor-like serine/threonine-protein kinase At4g27290 [Gossypium raimondii]|uniref:G-type lectin S-receptor-like serine/threonine-protein kinase At4g27290 n=1 Tax=Gossypium raimondii TaxID=29730 RepID=UPI00227A446B|nr:G-type lectin S-receptor-like serine/threonine-protein kinase At4g27290 [Gossypium raimondii]
MKIGINFVTGFDRHISSWKSMEDPAPGLYSMRIDLQGLSQLVVKKGPDITSRGGSWNGRYITGRPQPTVNPLYLYEFVWNKNEAYYKYKMRNSSIFSSTNESPPCKCLEGFMQGSSSPGDLSSVDWSNGCTRRTPLTCDGGDSFLKQTGLKLPDTSKSWADISVDLKEYPRGSYGCLLWFLDLIDITEFSKGGQDLYIRLATADLEHIQSKGKLKEKQKAAIIAISVITTCGMMILALWLYVRKKKLRKTGTRIQF